MEWSRSWDLLAHGKIRDGKKDISTANEGGLRLAARRQLADDDSPSPSAYGNRFNAITANSAGDVWAVRMFQNESTDQHRHRTLLPREKALSLLR